MAFSKGMRACALVCTFGALCQGAAAQAVLSSSQTIQRKQESAFSAELSLSSSSNLYARDESAHEADVGAEALLAYEFTKKLKSSLSLALSKALSGEEKLEAQDAALKLSHSGLRLNDTFKLGASFQGLIPLSEEAKDRSTQTILSLAPIFIADLKSMGLKGLLLSYSLSLSLGLYQYQTSASGRSNSPYGLSNIFTMGYEAFSGFQISALFAQNNRWTYEKNLIQSFQFGQEISYEALPRMTVALGHKNGGNVLRPNGQDSNIEVFNGRSSIVYSSLSYLF